MSRQLRYARITDDAGDFLTVLVDGVPATTIDLVNGASPEVRDILQKLGLDLEELLAAEWARD